jgi:hypothetical protein
MFKISKLKQISMAMFAIAISAFLIMSCAKQDETLKKSPELSQEMITPQAIVSGDIDPTILTKEQRTTFLLNHAFTQNGTSEASPEENYSSRILMKYLTAEEIVEIIVNNRDYGLSEKELWFTAFASKEFSNLYPRNIEDLSGKEYELILERAQKKTMNKLEGIS